MKRGEEEWERNKRKTKGKRWNVRKRKEERMKRRMTKRKGRQDENREG